MNRKINLTKIHPKGVTFLDSFICAEFLNRHHGFNLGGDQFSETSTCNETGNFRKGKLPRCHVLDVLAMLFNGHSESRAYLPGL